MGTDDFDRLLRSEQPQSYWRFSIGFQSLCTMLVKKVKAEDVDEGPTTLVFD